MKNTKSLLHTNAVPILPALTLKIPTVGEILEDEAHYYQLVSILTATPAQYMVPLDDMGIDYTTLSDYELFKMVFLMHRHRDFSMLFENLDVSDFTIRYDESRNSHTLFSPRYNLTIDELTYSVLADCLRKINGIEKDTSRPGNAAAREYLLERERKRLQKTVTASYSPYLENTVVALVNTMEFPYDYDSCMNLSIYRFNRSLLQIHHKIAFDNTMIGVYAGTVDISRINNKDCLSWISNKL